MYIAELKVLDKRQVIVKDDSGKKFRLYKSEIKRFKIEEGAFISDEVNAEIEDILKKRCRERALYILERAEKTEKDLRDRLKKGDYPDDIIGLTLDFMKQYDYINDYRYARDYVSLKKTKSGTRKIKYELIRKGISQDIIERVFDETESDTEGVIRNILMNRKFDFDTSYRKQIDKQIRYLAGRGFSYEDINNVIKVKRPEL